MTVRLIAHAKVMRECLYMSNEIDGILLSRELLTRWTGRELTQDQCNRIAAHVAESNGYFADGFSMVWGQIAAGYCRTDGCANENADGADGYAGYCAGCADMIGYLEDHGYPVSWDDDEWTLAELRRKHTKLHNEQEETCLHAAPDNPNL